MKEMMHKKWPHAQYIAYFQAFTNTYAPAPVLRELYYSILEDDGLVGISIATRPDCLPEDTLNLLEELNQQTYLWLELGLQTIHRSTAQAMNLGTAGQTLWIPGRPAQAGHTCMPAYNPGAAGEDYRMMMETAQALASLDIQGIKSTFCT